jgi:hypothetical protein
MKRGHTKGDIFVLIIVTLMFVSSCTPIGQGTKATEDPEEIGPGIPLYEDPDNLYGDFILHIGKQLLKNAGIPYDEDKARAIAHLTYTEEELQEMYNKANTLIPEGNGGCVPTVGGEGTECPLDDVTATSGNSGNDDGDIIDIDYPTGEDKPTYKG